MTEQSHRGAKLLTVLYFIIATIIISIKGIAGFLGNSRSMIFDAVHSFSTMISLVTIQRRKKMLRDLADQRKDALQNANGLHLGYLIIPTLFIVVGIEMLVHTVSNWGTTQQSATPWTILVIGIAMFLKELFYRLFQARFGKGNGMLAQILSSRSRAEMLPMILALVGTTLSVSSAWFQLNWLIYADAVAALVIGLKIMHNGYLLINQLYMSEHQETTVPADYMLITKTLEIVPGVIAVNEVHAKMICDRVEIRALVSVSPQMTMQEAYDVAKSCKMMIQSEFSNLRDVTVHVQPYGQLYPYKTEFQERNDYSSIVH